MEYLLLGFGALFAGFIDAVVGGGGLVQVPTLFAAYPRELPAMLIGTNKFSSLFGTSVAAWNYAFKVEMPWRTIIPAAVSAFIFAFFGAMAVSYFPRDWLRPLILIMLILAAIYIFARKDFGLEHKPRLSKRRRLIGGVLVGGVIGFYDGFFGPGSGGFFVFLFVRGFGFDFLHASASAKIVNVAANLAALTFFIPNQKVLVSAGILMAACNILGAFIGARMAIRQGVAFVRKMFLFVVILLICKFAHDLYLTL